MSIFPRFFPVLCGLLLISCAPAPSNTPQPEPTPPPTTTQPTPSTTNPQATEQGQVLPITATAKVVSSGKVFGLEVAETEEQQRLGLMYRQSLPDDRGMLFEFDPPMPVRFWMKNCLINLDMIFLRNGVVQAIAHDVPPCVSEPCPTYGTPAEIDQVIEIRGGLAKEIGLKEGDRLEVTKQTDN